MSVEIEAHTAPSHPRRAPVSSTRCDGAIFVGLVNNMPDAALASTEAQFSALLAAAAGRHSVQLRVSSLPEVPRGADAFVRHEQSLMLFFQGHPEYEDTTLLKEYRRDVGRYLNGQQSHYPTLPHGYLSAEGRELLEAFEARALAGRSPALLEDFPFAAAAATLRNTWRPAAVTLYRNWLDFIAAARASSAEEVEVSLAGP